MNTPKGKQLITDATIQQQKIQKTTKPKFDEVVGDFLSGDALKYALDFLTFLKQNKMNPRWASTSSWAVKHKNKHVCGIRLNGSAWQYGVEPGSWYIECANLLEILHEFEGCENLKKILWSNVKHCTKCCSCGPGANANIMGKQFENVCRIVIKNPDAEALTYAKQLVLASKKYVSEVYK
ncbi:MAG: hypothetical protein FWC89_14045 [Defluviitaleaceae bacterium]|nr:hypothetical protein [Defluviitaleaceae bacterium]